ncbi:MAG: 5-oxoprolinase subunit PxpB [Dehalococcoidia bacterium]|nr:5-oxoprolinase subunit PxpB [Dehalococcoidia bacterium]
MYEAPKFLAAGDRAIVIELGDEISIECNRRVHSLYKAISRAELPGVVDIIPTYRSLLVEYDASQVSYEDINASLLDIDTGSADTPEDDATVIHLPVLYGGAYGPDLEFVARNAGISADEVVDLHSGTEYPVYMMGFTPGFPYLGGMSERIATPRLSTPRGVIPAGSVGIAEAQTGVYPIESPGGWQLIGRTPLRLFDVTRTPPSLIDAGNSVRFVPLANDDEYQDIHEQVAVGSYQVTTTTKA